MNVTLPLRLLGGLSAERFMRQYWQKKPLLIRAALPDFKPLISEQDLLAWAGGEEVESRLVQYTRAGWTLTHGPLRKAPSMKKKHWTVLLQGMDLHVGAVHALLQQFRFVPDARLDDVMISLAGLGGGVGPHFDSYDVFLLQAAGRRRWRIGAQKDLALIEGAPLKILRDFKPTQDYVLEPGDLLYLPPRYAHDGVALDAGCQTYSIGFRAPRVGELAQEVLYRAAQEIADAMELDPKLDRLYQDKMQEATATPAQLPGALTLFALDAVAKVLSNQTLLEQLVGEYLTEPKPSTVFRRQKLAPSYQRLYLSAATRMSYDAKHVFINGESFKCSGADARLLRKLANERVLLVTEMSAASEDLRHAVSDFVKDGWLYVK